MTSLDNISKLDFNERCDGSPLWVKQVLLQQADFPLWKYPDRTILEEKIARFYQLAPDNVLVTNGADEGIQLILLGCKFNYLPFEKVLLPTPTFSMYEKSLKQWQLDYCCIDANSNHSVDQQQIMQQWLTARNSLLILVRPNNPTGEMLPKEFISELLGSAEVNNNMLLLDEAYSDFAEDNCEDFLSESNNLIILKTFSKAYGLAALRTGYILSNAKVKVALEKIVTPFNVSALSLQLCVECFSETAQDELQGYLTVIKQNRQLLTQALASQNCISFKSQGNFIFLDTTEKKSELLKNILKQKNILVRDFNEATLKNAIRITIPLNIEPLLQIFKLLEKPDLLCLDMDGTLIDVSQSYDNAIKKTVSFFASTEINQNEIDSLRNDGGFNNDWILSQRLLMQLGFELQLQQVTDKFQQFYLGSENTVGFIENEQSLINTETLKFFKQQRIAIVTGRPGNEAIIGTESLGLKCTIISMDDVENAKPHPESIEKAASIENATTIWMVGDNVDDMQCAIRSGALAIGIGRKNQQQLYQAGARIVLEDINQIQQLL